MRRALAWILAGALLAGLFVVPWLALDDAPAIEPPAAFRRADLAWVRSQFQKHDPRRQTPDVVQTIRLDEAELNRLLNYAVELHPLRGVAAELTPGQATLAATFAVPRNPFGGYLNVTADVAETPHGMRIARMRLGSLPVPAVLADWGMRLAHRWLRRDATYAALSDAFAQVHFDENAATLDYRWRPELLTHVERKSAAILIGLGERHPESGLVPPPGDPRRMQFLRWMAFVSSAIYSLIQTPDGDMPALRLVVISAVMAIGALVASEFFARRALRRVHGL